ncbi:MAG TPA: hypothetical protein VMF11_01100 [Candidatus Baltobacteraceae bacterium]|nr:hypothetical protein [Candidatus Baltobacteraceae bacterium]
MAMSIFIIGSTARAAVPARIPVTLYVFFCPQHAIPANLEVRTGFGQDAQRYAVTKSPQAIELRVPVGVSDIRVVGGSCFGTMRILALDHAGQSASMALGRSLLLGDNEFAIGGTFPTAVQSIAFRCTDESETFEAQLQRHYYFLSTLPRCSGELIVRLTDGVHKSRIAVEPGAAKYLVRNITLSDLAKGLLPDTGTSQ